MEVKTGTTPVACKLGSEYDAKLQKHLKFGNWAGDTLGLWIPAFFLSEIPFAQVERDERVRSVNTSRKDMRHVVCS